MTLAPSDNPHFREPDERACLRCDKPTDWYDAETGRCHVCSQLPDCCEFKRFKHTDDTEVKGVEIRVYRCPHGVHFVSMGLAGLRRAL